MSGFGSESVARFVPGLLLRLPAALAIAAALPFAPAGAAAFAATRSAAALTAASPGAAAERLAERVESEIRYPDADAGLDARSLACFAPARDLARLRSVPALEDDLRAAFFRRGIRLLLVDDAVREGAESRTPRPARASLAFLGDAESGEIRVQGDEPAFAAVSVGYASKPWVEDVAPYREEGARRGAVVVRGDSGLEGSEEAAIAAAVAAAAESLRDEAIRIAIEAKSRSSRLSAGAREAVSDRLASVLPAGIIERNFLSDRYLEELEKPYGSVYRASVLVRAEASALARAVGLASDDVDRERTSLLVKAGVLALAAPLLLGLYLWLDSATRGYFSGVLKVAFVLGFGGISWVVLQMSL